MGSIGTLDPEGFLSETARAHDLSPQDLDDGLDDPRDPWPILVLKTASQDR